MLAMYTYLEVSSCNIVVTGADSGWCALAEGPGPVELASALAEEVKQTRQCRTRCSPDAPKQSSQDCPFSFPFPSLFCGVFPPGKTLMLSGIWTDPHNVMQKTALCVEQIVHQVPAGGEGVPGKCGGHWEDSKGADRRPLPHRRRGHARSLCGCLRASRQQGPGQTGRHQRSGRPDSPGGPAHRGLTTQNITSSHTVVSLVSTRQALMRSHALLVCSAYPKCLPVICFYWTLSNGDEWRLADLKSVLRSPRTRWI